MWCVCRYWDLIQRHKVTQFYTAPTAIRSLMRHGHEDIANYDRSDTTTLKSPLLYMTRLSYNLLSQYSVCGLQVLAACAGLRGGAHQPRGVAMVRHPGFTFCVLATYSHYTHESTHADVWSGFGLHCGVTGTTITWATSAARSSTRGGRPRRAGTWPPHCRVLRP